MATLKEALKNKRVSGVTDALITQVLDDCEICGLVNMKRLP
mgnify:CR=1 FL=1